VEGMSEDSTCITRSGLTITGRIWNVNVMRL
jgi:hypothetical protein